MAKIVIFIYDTRIDRRALLQCKSLIAHGHQVTLYAPPYEDVSADPAYVKRLDKIAPPAQSLKSPEPPKPPKTFYQRALDCKRWLAEKYPKTLQWLLPIARPIFSKLYAMRISKPRPEDVFLDMFHAALAINHKADLYIAHDLPMLPVAVEAKRRYGGKVLYDSHELFPDQEWTEAESRMWRKMEQAYIGKADAVVTINPSIARIMEERYGLPKVEVIYNAEWVREGEVTRQWRFHEAFGLPREKRILLYQGGLSLGRNLERLVESFREVRDPSLCLIFLGSGPCDKTLDTLIAQHGLRDRVLRMEAVPQAELLGYTASADLGVIPYQDTCLNNRYCTPNKLFEFIAAGLPLIATDLPEISRIVSEYQIGLTGDTDDPKALMELITRAMQPEILANLRHNIVAARGRVNWQHEGEKFAAIIAKCVSEPPMRKGENA
jgi:glycosyltransferase involved in cell wall biosynthesis